MDPYPHGSGTRKIQSGSGSGINHFGSTTLLLKMAILNFVDCFWQSEMALKSVSREMVEEGRGVEYEGGGRGGV